MRSPCRDTAVPMERLGRAGRRLGQVREPAAERHRACCNRVEEGQPLAPLPHTPPWPSRKPSASAVSPAAAGLLTAAPTMTDPLAALQLASTMREAWAYFFILLRNFLLPPSGLGRKRQGRLKHPRPVSGAHQ